jgi:hypothetical protein
MTEERKIHYIDVGNLPPAECIKMLNEVRRQMGIKLIKDTWFTRLLAFLGIWGAI